MRRAPKNMQVLTLSLETVKNKGIKMLLRNVSQENNNNNSNNNNYYYK